MNHNCWSKGKVPKLSMAMKNVQKYLDKGTKAPWETMNTIRAFRSSGNPCQALDAEEPPFEKIRHPNIPPSTQY